MSPPHPLHPRAQPEPPAIGDWKCLQPRPWAGIRVGAAAPAVPFPPPSMHPLPALCHCNGELGGGGGSVLHPLPSLPACCWGEASLPPSASPLPPLPTSPHTDGGWVGFWCHPSDPHCAHWVPTPPSPPPPRVPLGQWGSVPIEGQHFSFPCPSLQSVSLLHTACQCRGGGVLRMELSCSPAA